MIHIYDKARQGDDTSRRRRRFIAHFHADACDYADDFRMADNAHVISGRLAIDFDLPLKAKTDDDCFSQPGGELTVMLNFLGFGEWYC